MGPLFWRMFLGLWLGSALLMVGSATVLALTAQNNLPQLVEERVSDLMRGVARAALDARQRDPAAFPAHVHALERDFGLRLFLVDARGRDLLGRAVPRELRDFEPAPGPRTRMRAGPRGPFDQILFVDTVREPDGREYRVLMTVAGPPEPPLSFLAARMAWPLLFSILVAGLISALAARHLVRPIAQLQGAVRQFASGALDHRVGDALRARHDEFSALARDFDGMADRIGALIATQRGLMLDLSHELRSPLARLRVALELARAQADPRALYDRMERDVERLDTLIGELLLLARLDSPELQPAAAAVDLDDLLREIVEDAALEAAASGHRVRREGGGAVVLHGDRELLRRALENVVRNALRHSPEGTEVAVSLALEGGQAVVRVADDGPGVDDALLGRLFTPFVRGEHASRDGNGLGLAIARAAVQRHGGTIDARHGAAGRGLTVEIRLPRPE